MNNPSIIFNSKGCKLIYQHYVAFMYEIKDGRLQKRICTDSQQELIDFFLECLNASVQAGNFSFPTYPICPGKEVTGVIYSNRFFIEDTGQEIPIDKTRYSNWYLYVMQLF